MMFWDGHDLGSWGWLAMIAGIVLVSILTASLVIWFLRAFDRPDRAKGAPSPDRVLAERFARGEIDRHEFAERIAAIRAADRPTSLVKN
jgi:putative membrane protein